MKINKLFFWIIIILICTYVIYHIGFTNNNFEHFVADINDYVETGDGYGNILYKQPESKHKLLEKTSTVFGHTLPYKPTTNAPIDNGNEPLFMFGKNKCSPNCCPSTYACSGGCVCTTEEQRNRIHGRK